MTDENDFYDSIVRTQMGGPLGMTWVIVDKDSRLGDLQAVLKAKLKAYKLRTGKDEADEFDLLDDSREHAEALKLHFWIKSREKELAVTFSPKSGPLQSRIIALKYSPSEEMNDAKDPVHRRTDGSNPARARCWLHN